MVIAKVSIKGAGASALLEIDMSNHLDQKRIPLFPRKNIMFVRYLYYGSSACFFSVHSDHLSQTVTIVIIKGVTVDRGSPAFRH